MDVYKKVFSLTFIVGLVLTLVTELGAWNDDITHKNISENASKHFMLQRTDFLKNIGYEKGLEIADNKSSDNTPRPLWRKHIEDGAIEEDAGNIFTAYYYNHFHNPLLSWDQAGLNTIYPFINGESSLLWAQDISNPWPWQKIRDYYYNALTAQTNTERETNFAMTFKGLGHIIHLIQDAAQPAHVRNDPHVLDDIGIAPQFENWAKDKKNESIVLSFMSNPIFPNVSLNTQVESYIPITQFWDTNQYTDTNPVGSTVIGLSEYTGANFFSEDTILSTVYPSWSNVIEYDEIIDDTIGEERTYLKKLGDGETIGGNSGYGDPVEHVATARWFYRYLPTEYKHLGLKLDDNVYKDYASLLLPRAAGYSAGLLKYFFRGKMDFVLDEGDRGDGLTGIRVYNLTDEEMAGTLRLYYDATDGIRYPLGLWSLLLTPQGTSPTLNFSFPGNNIEEHRYILVFRGRMGMEQDAVAGYIHGAGWREEWDAELYDTHNWVYSENDLVDQNPNNGETINTVDSGRLVKKNIRYAGSDMIRINETYIGVADEINNGTYYLGGYAIPYDFTDRFPMEVTPNTWLNLKIDAMSINEPIPSQSCAGTEWPTGAYQGINFYFRFDDGSTRTIVLTTSGHESLIWPTELIPLGLDYSVKIYDLLATWGGFTEPVYLDGINITQQMWNLCAPSSIEHRQQMEVDYIRVENR